LEQQTNHLSLTEDETITAELHRLREENEELRRKLGLHEPAPAAETTGPVEDNEPTGPEPEETVEKVSCGLTGIINSNRDHSSSTSWGKNQFNNSFPIGLISYMESKGIKPVYLKVDDGFKIQHSSIGFEELTGCAYEPSKIYYEFESSFAAYGSISSSPQLPSIDVIVKDSGPSRAPKRALEIKLTTLPDSTTAELSEDKYGSELVVRPDTIVYQALSISRSLASNREDLTAILNPVHKAVTNWEDAKIVAKHLPRIITAMSIIVAKFSAKQSPLLLQPVWKTEGKAAILAENCLDAFVWSDFSLMKLFIKNVDTERLVVSRNDRTIVWLFLMLHQFANTGKVNHTEIIDRYTYGTKNDKAFAVSGKITNTLMSCPELTKPRIKKTEIKNIILGNGQEHLSPERRFDGVIQSDVSIFK
jgi:hypothetical protein